MKTFHYLKKTIINFAVVSTNIRLLVQGTIKQLHVTVAEFFPEYPCVSKLSV